MISIIGLQIKMERESHHFMFSPTQLQKVTRVQLRHLYIAGGIVNFWKVFHLIPFFQTNISANLVVAAGESEVKEKALLLVAGGKHLGENGVTLLSRLVTRWWDLGRVLSSCDNLITLISGE